MAVVVDLAISILASVAILFTFYFAWKAFRSYSQTSHETYGVGQQQARVSMQTNMVWSVMLLFISLILWGVSGLSFGPVEAEQPQLTPADTPGVVGTPVLEATSAVIPTNLNSTPTATPTLAPLATVDAGVTPLATLISEPPTFTPPAQPSPTVTAAVATAVVSSGVGVWLRATPGTAGEQLEWLLDGTLVTVLPGKQQADDFEWQQVRTISGVEGWVAVDFIVYN